MDQLFQSFAQNPALLIPFASIVVSIPVGGAIAITAMIIAHREKMARVSRK